MTSNGIDFVDEDQTGAIFLGFLEQIADTTCADTHEHFDKLRAGQGEERNASFTSNRLGKQCLASSRRANQQQSTGNLSTNRRETLGLLQESHHFLEFLFGLSNTGDVIKHHTGFCFHHEASLALAELHGLTGTSGHAAVATGQEDQ